MKHSSKLARGTNSEFVQAAESAAAAVAAAADVAPAADESSP